MVLGRQLQAFRERAGVSYEEAADVIVASSWTVRCMEKAEVGLKPTYVRLLLPRHGTTVPGLVQTREYARALIEVGSPHAPVEEIERRVELRLARQALSRAYHEVHQLLLDRALSPKATRKFLDATHKDLLR
jgi:hypothetical protein